MQRSERLIGQIAARQDDVVSRAQLLEVGIARGEIDGRIARAQLRRRHRGVYLTGHAPPSTRTLARAALLACGEDAVISHETAAALWGLVAPPAEAEITVTGRNPGAKPGIRIHRVSTLHPSEVRVLHHGLRVTSPARTICDLAATSPRREVEHALQEAIVRRLVGEAQLRAVLGRAPARARSRDAGRPGRGAGAGLHPLGRSVAVGPKAEVRSPPLRAVAPAQEQRR